MCMMHARACVYVCVCVCACVHVCVYIMCVCVLISCTIQSVCVVFNKTDVFTAIHNGPIKGYQETEATNTHH